MTTDPAPAPAEIHISGDWAALYINGELEYSHHTEDVYERAIEALGVTVVHDNAFMQGGNGVARNGRPGPARTLAEVDAYRVERDARRERAANLRAEADRLRAEADTLESER